MSPLCTLEPCQNVEHNSEPRYLYAYFIEILEDALWILVNEFACPSGLFALLLLFDLLFWFLYS